MHLQPPQKMACNAMVYSAAGTASLPKFAALLLKWPGEKYFDGY